MTIEEQMAIDKYLGILIKKSKTCRKCAHRSEHNSCFFACECFPNYKWFMAKADESDEPVKEITTCIKCGTTAVFAGRVCPRCKEKENKNESISY